MTAKMRAFDASHIRSATTGIEMHLLVVMLIRKVSKQYKVKPSVFYSTHLCSYVKIQPRPTNNKQTNKQKLWKTEAFFFLLYCWPQL